MRSKERNGEKGKRRKACPGLDPGAKGERNRKDRKIKEGGGGMCTREKHTG
jgi:hypothetical protein